MLFDSNDVQEQYPTKPPEVKVAAPTIKVEPTTEISDRLITEEENKTLTPELKKYLDFLPTFFDGAARFDIAYETKRRTLPKEEVKAWLSEAKVHFEKNYTDVISSLALDLTPEQEQQCINIAERRGISYAISRHKHANP